MLDFFVEQSTHCLSDLLQLETLLQLTLHLITELPLSTLLKIEAINAFE